MNCQNKFTQWTGRWLGEGKREWVATPCSNQAVYIERMPNLPFPHAICESCAEPCPSDWLEEIEDPDTFEGWR